MSSAVQTAERPVIRSRTFNAALVAKLGSMGDVRVTIDFETYWDNEYQLRRMTTESYVRDPRFEVIGVGVKFGSRPSIWLEEWEFREWARTVEWSRVAVNAHHAHFDGLILSHHYNIRPGFWFDTLSMARCLHGTGEADLKTLGPRYGLGEKGDELKETRGKHRVDFTQTEWERFGRYCTTDVDLTDGLLDAMAVEFPTEELWLIDTNTRSFTEPIFNGDGEVLAKALKEERERKAALMARVAMLSGDVEEPRTILGSSEKFAALLRAFGIEPPTKKSKTSGELIYAFAKDDAGMASLLDHESEDVWLLAEARLETKSNIVESRVERVIHICARGLIPFYLKYCGAHTHRASGGDKMNPQNFNRGGALRAAILAPLLHLLVVADSGQIEARVLAWLAGDVELLETFRRNDALAAAWLVSREKRIKTLGRKPTKEESKAMNAELATAGIVEGDFYSDRGSAFFLKKISKEETPIERQLSKNMILGLGFGMGWARFALELLKGMLGSDPVQFTRVEAERFRVNVAEFELKHGQRVREIVKGGARLGYDAMIVHCAVADHFVRLYRRTSPQIVGLWRAAENILQAMVQGRGMKFGPLEIIRNGIVKPNGMVLRYPGLRRESDGFSYLGGKTGKKRTKIYGGLLVENIVQSLARDVVMEQSLRVRAAYSFATKGQRSPIGTTTHDEIVAVVPEWLAENCLEFMLRTMREPPAWCADLPLNASGGFGKSYGEVK